MKSKILISGIVLSLVVFGALCIFLLSFVATEHSAIEELASPMNNPFIFEKLCWWRPEPKGFFPSSWTTSPDFIPYKGISSPVVELLEADAQAGNRRNRR